MYASKIKIKGHHGTADINVDSILKNNFNETIHDKWLGDGVYFFVEGINIDKTTEIAFEHTLDKVTEEQLECEDIVVLEADIAIKGDKYLDLTITEGLKRLNSFKANLLQKLVENNKKIKGGYFQEVDALKIMRKTIGIEFVKANVYIRIGIQKENEVQARLPNVTIFAVNNPQNNISRYSIKEVYRKKVVI